MTPAESLLWRFLRNGHIGGLHFRRQHPIGRYVADFCCVSRRLVIELDGHSHDERDTYDAERTADLAANGYRVMRFLNEDVLQDPESVTLAIAEACGVRLQA